MIPILYESNETAFVSNGICRLTDCLSCVVTEERNGIYECDFEYPVNGAYYDQIQCGRIIGCTHEDSDDIQPFDIVSYSRPINGIVSFHAVHISYRQTELVAVGTNINSLESAFTMLGNAVPSNPFTYETDITSTNYMASADGVPRSVRQMLGGIEGSILDSYGGEYKWDKFTVHLWRNRGTIKEVTIRYGLNLVNYDEDVDYFGTYTSAIPYWKGNNGEAGEVVVIGSHTDSELESYSGRDICVPLDLSDKFENMPTTAQLEVHALSMMQTKNVNMPSQSISVDFIHLSELERNELAKCKLCDSIRVLFPRYGTDRYFKIVKTEFDVLQGRYTNMELGNLSTSLSEALGLSNSPDKQASGLADGFNYTQYTASFSITANNTSSGSIDVTRNGYKAIGISGWNSDNNSAVPIRLDIWSDQTVHYVLRNFSATAITGTLYVKVLYVAN